MTAACDPQANGADLAGDKLRQAPQCPTPAFPSSTERGAAHPLRGASHRRIRPRPVRRTRRQADLIGASAASFVWRKRIARRGGTRRLRTQQGRQDMLIFSLAAAVLASAPAAPPPLTAQMTFTSAAPRPGPAGKVEVLASPQGAVFQVRLDDLPLARMASTSTPPARATTPPMPRANPSPPEPRARTGTPKQPRLTKVPMGRDISRTSRALKRTVAVALLCPSSRRASPRFRR